jgi:hypothetical protein
MRYIKLKLTWGDKLRFLFLGVVPESKLEVVRLERLLCAETNKKPTRPPMIELTDEINTNEKEETFVVPFFDLSDEETKSNF